MQNIKKVKGHLIVLFGILYLTHTSPVNPLHSSIWYKKNLIFVMLMLICITASHCKIFYYNSVVFYSLRSIHSTVHRSMIDDEDKLNLILLLFIEDTGTVKTTATKNRGRKKGWPHVDFKPHVSRVLNTSSGNPMNFFSLLKNCSLTISACNDIYFNTVPQVQVMPVSCSDFLVPLISAHWASLHLPYCMLTLINVYWWLFSEINFVF